LRTFATCASLFLLAVGLQKPGKLFACGPDFPNSLLDGGDTAVLVAPVADFIGELQRMKLVESRFQAVPLTGEIAGASFATQTAVAELTDLTAALKKSKLPDDEVERIRSTHQAAREQLSKFLADTEAWANSRPWDYDEKGAHRGKPQSPQPQFPNIEVPVGLPGEFADYLEGALAWHNPAVVGKGMACAAWERLLERPPNERRFKSTWAAFMLGKASEEDEPDKAVQYFKQVRELARHGFADSVGLAAASLGLEARVCLQQKKYDRAIELYLEQLSTGDPTAGPSLISTAAEVLQKGPDVLRPLAVNPRTQRVLTAYVISRHRNLWFAVDTDNPSERVRPGLKADASRAWLEAVEAAEVRDVESAAKLGLAAYQNNDMPLAWRWIKRAPGSPVGQWLQAKLLLHDGKAAQAAELLASVAHAFPIEPPSTNRIGGGQFKDLLSIEASGNRPPQISADRQVLGELGVLRLARREYVQSLDALLNAGFWMDSAYIAERVLTLDELKTYVDGYWPPVPPEQVAEENEKYGQSEVSPVLLRTQIRYLLARRLMRSFRGDEAREYYPAEWMPQYLVLAQALRTGWDEALPADQRAKALFLAAMITRTNGMELIGTEVEPDWRVHAGDYQEGVTVSIRATNENARALVASEDELDRARRHKADPELRWHYRAQAGVLAWEAAKLMPDNFQDATRMLLTGGRWLDSCGAEGADTLYFQAAALAWEAAKLMPDNSEDTARFLCVAGSWIKYRDPKKADIFYKALVRRNHKTAIGMEADRIRWFPRLDEQGNLIPRKPSHLDSIPPPALPEPSAEEPPDTEADEAAREYPIPGKAYVIHKGDSLAKIAQAASVFGQVITIEVILKANPGLDAARLRVGQKIIIPDDKAEGSTAPIPDGSIPAPNNEGTPDAPASPAPSQEPPTSGAPAGAE
jgi:LysM repeat protein